MRIPLTLLCVCVLAGCASKPAKQAAKPPTEITSYTSNGAVKADLIVAPVEARYEVKPGVSFSPPQPGFLNLVPAYPPDLLVKRLEPVGVIARVVVNAEGAVDNATVVHNSSPEQAFADETLLAVKYWRFQPLTRTEGTVTEALPFTQHYRFTFKQVDGRAVVTTGVSQ